MPQRVDIDEGALAQEMRRIGEVSERVRLAGFGLAQPLLRMRRGQLEREVGRVVARMGADHPGTAEANAALARATRTVGLFDGELGRARVDRPVPGREQGAGISGRVVESGAPVAVAGVTVTAWAGKERDDFACTDAGGAFTLEVASGRGIVLSVRADSGAELYRDAAPDTLAPGQLRFREIDLDRAVAPCPDPGDEPPTDHGTFSLVNVVGQAERDAMAILKAQGLAVGAVTRQPSADAPGRVLAQAPKARSKVKRGDAVSLVVGETDAVTVPDLVGIQVEAVPAVLERSGLQLGEARAVEVAGAKEGMVTSQAPAAGSRVVRGDKVDVEFGRRRNTRPIPQSVVRLAMLAEERLRAQGVGADEPVMYIENRLAAAGVADEDALDALLAEDPKIVKERLGLRTLADTAKVVAALRRAREQLGGSG